MRVISLGELRQLCQEVQGQIDHVYFHWSAGNYHNADSCYNDRGIAKYHLAINGQGQILLLEEDLSRVLAHTYCRNTGAIGITVLCAVGATTQYWGSCPPLQQQVEMLAQALAVMSEGLALPLDVPAFQSHAEAADDLYDVAPSPAYDGPYGPEHDCERWDWWFAPIFDEQGEIIDNTPQGEGGKYIRGKGVWYQQNPSPEMR